MQEIKFWEIIDKLLDSKADMDMDTELADIAEWDSLTRIKFIVMMMEDYGIAIPRFEVAAAENMGDLFKLVQENSQGE